MTQFDINQIQKILPHRYPFLMIDRVIEVDSGKTLTAIKNVSANEPFFEGHFPHFPFKNYKSTKNFEKMHVPPKIIPRFRKTYQKMV